MKVIANTDHGPKIPDSPHIWKISKQKKYPTTVLGVRVLKGVEANIVDFRGTLDIESEILDLMEWVVVSLHKYVIKPSTIEEHTRCWLEIAKNPKVDLIAHSGDESYKYDYETVIKSFKDYRKIVEINNNTFIDRKKSLNNVLEIAHLCEKYKVPIAVNSDAHFCTEIGECSLALKMLQEIKFPKELIVNESIENFNYYMKEYRKKDIQI